MCAESHPEPWLRGTLTDISTVQRAAIHALQLAEEDLEKFCGALSAEELNVRPMNLAPVAFHIRHIARSVDRLLTYAEGKELSPERLLALQTELEPGASRDEVFAELRAQLERAAARIRAIPSSDLGEARWVGKKHLPSTVGGLLVHIAEHTQRHVGQAITTAKIVRARRE
jgi:uncharacterized damage-inducible protein DinB